MASTRKVAEALDYALNMIKAQPVKRLHKNILQAALNHLWMAAPWRFSLGNVTAITQSSTQDYTQAPPADFLYPVYAYLSDSTNVRYLKIEPIFAEDVVQTGLPSRVSYMGSNTWRVYPKPGAAPGITTKLNIVYKKTCLLLTDKNIYDTAGIQVFDDEWFHVYEAGVLYFAYLYADDQRAGSAKVSSEGKFEFSGQLAIFEAFIQLMKQREPLPIFGIKTAPARS